LLGGGSRPALDVLLASGHVVERDEAALLLEARHGGGARVEDQTGCVAGRDRGADDLLGGLAGRDLLAGDLLVRVGLVPG